MWNWIGVICCVICTKNRWIFFKKNCHSELEKNKSNCNLTIRNGGNLWFGLFTKKIIIFLISSPHLQIFLFSCRTKMGNRSLFMDPLLLFIFHHKKLIYTYIMQWILNYIYAYFQFYSLIILSVCWKFEKQME